LIYRQYTALESGLLGTFPGPDSYPDDFDVRRRLWYDTQKASPGLRWSAPHTDVISGAQLTNATMPIYDSANQFLGVTGLDMRWTNLLETLRLPAPFGSDSNVLLTFLDEPNDGEESIIEVLAKANGDERAIQPGRSNDVEELAFANPADLKRLVSEMLGARAGYFRVNCAGRDVLCVYRPADDPRSYLLFLVASEAVVNPGLVAAKYALSITKRQVDKLIPSALGIMLIVAFVAVISSRTVTQPIEQLVDASERVGRGELDVRVAINTGDELERLGNAFNNMVPQLEERTSIREALSLTSEVQRRLLPDEGFEIAELDVSGFSLYCDQTGGDYYDFLNLSSAEANYLGIALGDVAGHGIASTLLMATVRALLRGIADAARNPDEVLRHINGKLSDDVHPGQFMTLFFSSSTCPTIG
jgi:sigma-B regulation protein RsbU (phosphoserine phosphatase)